jgi:hypothetical protein
VTGPGRTVNRALDSGVAFALVTLRTELAVAQGMPHDNSVHGPAPIQRALLSFEERVQAVMAFGFTPRQASFLTTVMVHAGVCLPRQYTTFCRIVFGHTTRDFFARLVRDRFATAYPCWRRRGGSLYHVHHKALYRAIGEPDNRHRRPVTVARAVERLMLLDVVLGQRDLNWLATEREKVAHFTVRNISAAALPAFVLVQAGARIIRHFPDKFPIGLRVPSDEVVFVYLVTSGNAQEVQRFLVRHKPLFRHLSRLTVRFVFPAVLAGGQPQVELATAFFSEPPIRHAVLEEFRHYCRARRAIETSCEPEISPQRYAQLRRAFAAKRFGDAYHAWLTLGAYSGPW